MEVGLYLFVSSITASRFPGKRAITASPIFRFAFRLKAYEVLDLGIISISNCILFAPYFPIELLPYISNKLLKYFIKFFAIIKGNESENRHVLSHYFYRSCVCSPGRRNDP